MAINSQCPGFFVFVYIRLCLCTCVHMHVEPRGDFLNCSPSYFLRNRVSHWTAGSLTGSTELADRQASVTHSVFASPGLRFYVHINMPNFHMVIRIKLRSFCFNVRHSTSHLLGPPSRVLNRIDGALFLIRELVVLTVVSDSFSTTQSYSLYHFLFVFHLFSQNSH